MDFQNGFQEDYGKICLPKNLVKNKKESGQKPLERENEIFKGHGKIKIRFKFSLWDEEGKHHSYMTCEEKYIVHWNHAVSVINIFLMDSR